MRRLGFVAVAVVSALACGPDSQAEWSDDADDGVELSLSELNAARLLPALNAASTTLAVLTEQAGLDSRAARNIIAARDGVDAQPGTADDQPFRTVEQLDAVPWVGPATLALLDAWAAATPGGTSGGPSVTVEGVVFTAQEAVDALATANGPRLIEVGLYSVPYGNLVAARPYATLAQVGAVAQVGPAALTLLRSYVQRNPSTPAPAPAPPPTGCTGRGGTFDGVTFTQAEDCHAVSFLNRARFSEMGALPAFARQVAYLSGPDGVYSFTGPAWVAVEQFSNRSGIGATAMAALKAAAATWTPNGLEEDTVAATWANRERLVNGPLYLHMVYVTKVFPRDLAGSEGYQCGEVRDAPGAPNYLLLCIPTYLCEGGVCWTTPVGGQVSGHGTLRRTTMPGSGGYRLTLNNLYQY